jgi:hypothetical protein
MPYSTCVFYDAPGISGFFRETGEGKIRVDTYPLWREYYLGLVELIMYLSVSLSSSHGA